MNGQFLYVFSPEERDKLVIMGFVLLKEDDRSRIYTFKADEALMYSLYDAGDIAFLLSDTLTF